LDNLPTNLANSGALDIQKHLESISGGKILDIATEGGDFILTLINFLSDYDSFIGIDILKKKWDDKRFTNYPVEFCEMNAELLEFEDSTFDTVCISHSLHHLSAIEKVSTEMKRVLKPNGNLILQEMFCDEPQSDAQKVDISQHHWGAKIDKLFEIPHRKTLTKQAIKEVVTNLHLAEEKIFESTHYVKCLKCDDKFECDDPKNEDIINFAIKEVDEDLHRLQKGLGEGVLENNTYVKALLLEGEKIKKRIRKYGSSPASQLFVIGKK
jgi:ubiquinone/menaquinone biosynthesis C-methylase UbiE